MKISNEIIENDSNEKEEFWSKSYNAKGAANCFCFSYWNEQRI